TSFTPALSLNVGSSYQTWVRPIDLDGRPGSWAAPANFDVVASLPLAAPTLTGPTGSINATAATVSWIASNGATAYDLLVYNLGTGQQAAAPTGIAGTTYAANLGAGSFQVFARATNATDQSSWSTPLQFDLTGTGSTLSVPTLTGPSGSVNAGTVTITWNTATGAAAYDLLAYNINTGQEVANFSGLTGTSQSVNLSSGQHQVFLRADDGAGTVTNWSTPFVFDVTGSAAPTVPTLTGPAGTANAGSVAILWTGVSNAANYELLVYNISTGQEVVNAAGITADTFTPSASFVAGNRYQVFLRAVDGSGNAGAWATPLEFDVVSAERLLDATNGIAPAADRMDAVFTALEIEDDKTVSADAVPATVQTESPVEFAPAAVIDFADTDELDSVLAGWHNTEWWNETELTAAEANDAETDSNPAPALLLAGAAFGITTPLIKNHRKPKSQKRNRLQ
ncbi:MAG: hypothetical protein IID45_14625, partial [Planctomycetes bacterium]|nr:hypothetical protein [Planctomycetota bacterium]